MKDKIRNFGIDLISWREFLSKERKYNSLSDSLKKAKLILRGFYSLNEVPFDFSRYNYKDFITDVENIKLSYLNYPNGRLLRDKLIFSLFFRNFCNVPEIYALIDNGKIYCVNKNYPEFSFDSIVCFLNEKILILKPRFGTSGQGVFKVQKISQNEFKINNKNYSFDEFKELILSLDDYIAVEFIQQGKFSEKFFRGSTNTIRITTYYDQSTNSGKILYALMRFGLSKSAPVDNVGAGGIYSRIDLDSGKLNYAIELLKRGKYRILDSHPETGVNIKGEYIPYWNKLEKDFTHLAEYIYPYIKFSGWDIILTDNSYYLIEGNNGPELYIQGPDKPLAIDEIFIEFLRENNIR